MAETKTQHESGSVAPVITGTVTVVNGGVLPASVPAGIATPLIVTKPQPKTFTPEEIKRAEKVVTQTYYRLNFRNRNGAIRGDISKEVVRQLSVQWSDLLRVIPNYRWSTFEEILELVWSFERKNVRNTYTRTRKQVEEGVAELQHCGVLEQK